MIVFKQKANIHSWAADDDHEKCLEYAKLIDSPLDDVDEDGAEADFSR